jgi:hypothetical protein
VRKRSSHGLKLILVDEPPGRQPSNGLFDVAWKGDKTTALPGHLKKKLVIVLFILQIRRFFLFVFLFWSWIYRTWQGCRKIETFNTHKITLTCIIICSYKTVPYHSLMAIAILEWKVSVYFVFFENCKITTITIIKLLCFPISGTCILPIQTTAGIDVTTQHVKVTWTVQWTITVYVYLCQNCSEEQCPVIN